MRFRTEIEPVKTDIEITPDTRFALIGSCFADEIRRELTLDGIEAAGGELGPLFNPKSIERIIRRGHRPYTLDDLTAHDGIWHCLDWANRYQHPDPGQLLTMVNRDYSIFSRGLENADVVIITFGNTKVYETAKGVAGNCHKLPQERYTCRRLSLEEIVESWKTVDLAHRKVIMTLSPVRYTENGLSQSNLAKSTLRLAIDRICKHHGWDYFPSFEILNDDLRDYRFYASDLKHPSETAVSYIYEKFCDTYMSAATRRILKERRKEMLTRLHRPNM